DLGQGGSGRAQAQGRRQGSAAGEEGREEGLALGRRRKEGHGEEVHRGEDRHRRQGRGAQTGRPQRPFKAGRRKEGCREEGLSQENRPEQSHQQIRRQESAGEEGPQRPRRQGRRLNTVQPSPHPRITQRPAMTVRIQKKITGYSVATPEDSKGAAAPAPAEAAAKPSADVIQMHERIERPDVLIGSTYKIKSPLVEHAMYVTINDIVLNGGTEHEQRRPFEIFINSKSMEHFQWI